MLWTLVHYFQHGCWRLNFGDASEKDEHNLKNEWILFIELDVPLETSLWEQGWSVAGKDNSIIFMAYVYTLCTILCFDKALFITWWRPLKECWPEQAVFKKKNNSFGCFQIKHVWLQTDPAHSLLVCRGIYRLAPVFPLSWPLGSHSISVQRYMFIQKLETEHSSSGVYGYMA